MKNESKSITFWQNQVVGCSYVTGIATFNRNCVQFVATAMRLGRNGGGVKSGAADTANFFFSETLKKV